MSAKASLNEGHGTKTASAKKRIFLSHSHKDKELIEGGGIFLLKLMGDTFYVDWLDDDMPESTSHTTARRIKEQIDSFPKFILLATPNALASRWVPWELGIADGLKGFDHMAILAVNDPKIPYKGNEYVKLYPWIGKAESGNWAVFDPATDTGPSLKTWLAR